VGVSVGEPVATVGPGVGDEVGYPVGDCQATRIWCIPFRVSPSLGSHNVVFGDDTHGRRLVRRRRGGRGGRCVGRGLPAGQTKSDDMWH
jgi:hypothetical protein